MNVFPSLMFRFITHREHSVALEACKDNGIGPIYTTRLTAIRFSSIAKDVTCYVCDGTLEYNMQSRML